MCQEHVDADTGEKDNMNALIVEDDYTEYSQLKRILEILNCSVFDQVKCKKDFDLIQRKTDVSFAFVDIVLLGTTEGIDIAIELNKLQIPFCFLSANTDKAIMEKALWAEPAGYLAKPFSEMEIIASTAILKTKISTSTNLIGVRTKKGTVKLQYKDINYVLGANVYIEIYGDNFHYLERLSIKKFIESAPNMFVRITKSCVINKSKITSWKSNAVFIGNQEFRTSKHYHNFTT
jgi:DNA-binding LytR/AlgR family response regulator